MSCTAGDCQDVTTACASSALEPIGTASAAALTCNLSAIDKVVNGSVRVTTRTGKQILSLEQLQDLFGFGVAPFDFATGGTLQSVNQLVLNSDGFYYHYTGAVSNIPLVIAAGFDPTASADWETFTATVHNLLSGRNAANSHQQYRESATVTQIESGVYELDTILSVTDRADAPFNVEPIGAYVVNGFNILNAGIGKVAVLQVVDGVANVMHFGAKGVGNSHDDAPPCRAAVAYLHARGGGKVRFPKPPVHYSFKSTVLTTTEKKASLIIPEPLDYYGDPIALVGEVPMTPIRGEIPHADGFSVIYFEGFSQYKQLKNLDVWGGPDSSTPLYEHVLYGADNYHALLTMQDCRFYVCVEDCVRLATYVTVLTKVQTAYSKKGIKIAGPNDDINSPQTSVTLSSCYALNHSENGYWFGNATYCTFNSCAADHITGYPYYFQIARGVTMNGCGAESSYGILECTAFQGLTINGLMTLSIGLDAPTPYDLIKLDGGTSATIAGLHNQNPVNAGIRKMLKVGNSFQTECVTILDRSISPDQVDALPNAGFDYPVKFVVFDKSNADYTWNITNAGNLIDVLASFENLEINHTYTLQFPSNDMALGASIVALSTTTGTGTIIFKGATNTRLVLIGGDRLTFGDTPSTLNVFIDNMDIHMQNLTGAGRGLVVDGRNVSFINDANITSNGSYEWGMGGYANINFDATSESLTPVFNASDRATVTISPLPAQPTSTHYPVRTTVLKDIPDNTNIGWIKGASAWLLF